MRIIAGEWRGRKLIAPTGIATRPTADRAREGLFSMLQSRLGSFEDLRIADLFAGSGALGLEALSRGAAHCLFIDNDRAAADAIKTNVAALGAGEKAEIRQQSVKHAMPPAEPCDLILLDPPYGARFADKALALVAADAWLKPHAMLSIETEGDELVLPEGLAREAHRRFGKAHIHLLRRTG